MKQESGVTQTSVDGWCGRRFQEVWHPKMGMVTEDKQSWKRFLHLKPRLTVGYSTADDNKIQYIS
jgi:hypothetical protein